MVILGGGLAGLTMALQLERDRAQTRVLVVDRRGEPAPEAAFEEIDLEGRGAVVAA